MEGFIRDAPKEHLNRNNFVCLMSEHPIGEAISGSFSSMDLWSIASLIRTMVTVHFVLLQLVLILFEGVGMGVGESESEGGDDELKGDGL